jgi:sulfate adenylyltransferase subunit 2
VTWGIRETPAMLDHLQRLESESIHILREVVAECERPVMLYSIGKDSACMVRLAQKAFYPSVPPFPLLHVDTTWKFRDMYAMRERIAQETGMELLVYHNPEAMALGINPFEHGSQIHTDMWKTQGLKQALEKYGFDAAFGGARRDEEKSRAKERFYSFRDEFGQWDPKNQRPELWSLYNGRVRPGENIRVFPISNWTELDVWQYIRRERVELPSIYFAHPRQVVRRGTALVPVTELTPPRDGDPIETLSVRFRTVGDITCTAPVESSAATLDAIVEETQATRISERGATRLDDQTNDAAMELRKKEGYF